MLGISRGIFESPPKKKQLRELLKAHTKRVKTLGGEEKDQLFCADCGLPIKEGKHRVYQSRLICSMCYWIYNLDLLNVKSPGYLIWAPELSQPEVTSFAIALKYSSEFQDTEEVSEEIESFFEDKRDLLERTIGEGTSDPTILCQFLYSLSDDDYENRGKIIKNMRLFPSDEFLSEAVEFLKTNELNKYTPERWVGLLQHVNEEMSKNNN